MNDVSSSFLSFLYFLCYVHGVVPAQISTKLSSGLGLYVVFLLLNGVQKGCVARPCGFDRVVGFLTECLPPSLFAG